VAKIRWTEEASIRLEDIYRCIAEDNPEAAKRVVAGIVQKAKML